MPDKPYDEQKICEAVAMFEGQGLAPAEALLASARLFTASLARFKNDAQEFRIRTGDEAARDFASEELNELIYDIQDSVPVAVRVFNSLMRDADQKPGEGPE